MPSHIVQAERRLSDSLLFTLQRRYFEQAGIEAWRTATVPHYITNNPALAYAYAQVFLGFIRDCRDMDAGREAEEPITLIELGAGSGRFAYLFLRALGDLLKLSPFSGIRFRYVMTDLAEKNLAFWRGHDALRPFVEQGRLDFALFDTDRDRELRLVCSGETLSPGSQRRPLGVIANYVFDGIAQDVFSFTDGELHEGLLSLSWSQDGADAADPEAGLERHDPELLQKLNTHYRFRPAPLDYYEEPELNAILRGYAASLRHKTILFPVGAIRCIDRLAALSSGGLLLVTGDRGHHAQDEVCREQPPELSIHGSFSTDVNYHAIAEHVRRRHGAVLQTTHRQDGLSVSAFLLGAHPSGYAETRLAFEQGLARLDPQDAYTLRRGVQAAGGELELEPMLSLIRLSCSDPRVLRDGLPVLYKHALGAPARAAKEVVHTVMQAWQNYYHIGEEHDLAFDLALLALGYGGHAEALQLFRESVRLYGDDPRARWNMGLCHSAMGEVEAALACFQRAWKLDPHFAPAGAAQTKTKT